MRSVRNVVYLGSNSRLSSSSQDMWWLTRQQELEESPSFNWIIWGDGSLDRNGFEKIGIDRKDQIRLLVMTYICICVSRIKAGQIIVHLLGEQGLLSPP